MATWQRRVFRSADPLRKGTSQSSMGRSRRQRRKAAALNAAATAAADTSKAHEDPSHGSAHDDNAMIGRHVIEKLQTDSKTGASDYPMLIPNADSHKSVEFTGKTE